MAVGERPFLHGNRLHTGGQGANLGGAIPPLLATAGQGIPARRVALGNLIVRATGCLIALPLAGQAAGVLAAMPLPHTGLAVEAHLAFNLVLAAAIWPFSGLITRLIARFYDPEEGTVSIGGVPLPDMGSSQVMRWVAPVFQDVYLFDGTILDNIWLGKPEATRDQVIAAGRQARVDEIDGFGEFPPRAGDAAGKP